MTKTDNDERQFLLYSEFSVILTQSFSLLWQFFGQVQKVNFHHCQFSVMFKFFGQIHSVILNRSNDYSS